MRGYTSMAALASLALMTSINPSGSQISMGFPNYIVPIASSGFSRKRSYIAKTGRAYPHSSTRQRARYARQIAAGQLKF